MMPLLSFYQIKLGERKKYAMLLHCGTARQTYRATKWFHRTIRAMFFFSFVRPDSERIELLNAADFLLVAKKT